MGRHSRPDGPTQVQYPWRAVVRTLLGVGLALVVAAPTLFEGLPSTALWGAVGVILGLSGVVTRVLAVPAVNAALTRYVPWLAPTPRE